MADKDSQNVESFIKLLTARQERIYAYILSLVPQTADADDIMQDVTTVMWRKFETFQVGSDFAAWGIAIARYKVMDYRKQQQGKHIYLSDEAIKAIEADLEKTLHNHEDKMEALKSCIKKLGRNDRRIIQMRYYEEKPAQDIARRLRKHVRTIYKILARIQNQLLYCVHRTLISE